MWLTEHSIETTVSPDAIWQQWADVVSWPEWNGDIEHIELDGPFAVGSRITMTPIGQDPIELRIAETAKPTLFVDEADLGEIVVRNDSPSRETRRRADADQLPDGDQWPSRRHARA